jgi:hypothetical protein
MVYSRLILCACLLVVALALGVDAYPRWCKPAPASTCPHANACPYCRGWDAFQAGVPLSDNPYGAATRQDPTLPGFRWNAGWHAGKRNSQYPIATAVDE